MKKSFKLLSLTLSLIMAISAFSALGLNVNAAISPVYDGLEINYFDYTKTTVGETEYGEFEYSVSQYDRACLVKFLGKVTENMIIPAEIDGKKVVEIGPDLFSQKEVIETVALPYGLQVIAGTFNGCVNLESIDIPESVYSINYAFVGCNSLTTVTVPDSVIDMMGVFDYCDNLQEITLGKKAGSLNVPYAPIFEGCTFLKKINVSDDNPYYKSIDGVLFDKDVETLICYPAFASHKELESVSCYYDEETGMFNGEEEYVEELNTSYYVPIGVKEIAIYAFSGADYLTDLMIPETVETIGDHAVGYTISTASEPMFTKNDELTIYCRKGTAAQQYAIDNGFEYDLLDEESIKGDINGDGVLDITDVVIARSYIVGNIELTPEQISSGDMNGDGEIGIIDVVAMRSTIVSGVKQDIKAKSVTDLDLAFLKLENEKKNKIYSPLSIGTALKMLEEGADGNTKAQISNVLGDYIPTNYKSNKNMSFGNGLFIWDAIKDSVKQSYTSTLKNNYDADVILDPFETPDNINKWIEDKTLGLIKNFFDEAPKGDLVLANALGIDMEWKSGFSDGLNEDGLNEVYYENVNYSVSKYNYPDKFGDYENISGMGFFASMDNYDIVNTLGEENIRKTVGDAYREFINENGTDAWGYKLTDPNEIETEINEYLDNYIDSLNRDYENNGEKYSTDFSLYTDDEVKVIAKDLKEYNGTTLQYIGIMPTAEDLDKFVEKVNSEKLNSIIENLKELKKENFKDGVITRIKGFVPEFDFEYDLDFKNDLKSLGITDVFDEYEADLSKLTTIPSYVSDAKHKAKIEFSEDGIKAAAVTAFTGPTAPAPEPEPKFRYNFDVPVEDIDLTFDNPYMFIIRDKDTGEIWFVGTVYEPTLFEFYEEY